MVDSSKAKVLADYTRHVRPKSVAGDTAIHAKWFKGLDALEHQISSAQQRLIKGQKE